MAISSDIEAEIYVRDGVIYLTRDIANQVYTETGLIAVGTLKGRNNLEADKQYLADNGHWYKNIGGNRTWEATSGTPDEQLIPITWKYLYESLNNKENQLIQNLNGILGQNNGEFPVEQAVAGNVYYFPRNQKYYYCLKNQTSRVSVPNADFEELSIYQNHKKLENLFTTKEEKTKLSLAQINNVNLNTITEPGFYTSSGWSNNIVNLPAELNHNEGRAFYLLVFALENGAYCQQILYSFKGLIFYRAITGANSAFTQWKKLT